MIEEQKAKALFAGGVALFVTGLVVLMLFVIPAARHTQVAMAQDEGDMAEPPADPGAEPPMDPAMDPAMMDPAAMDPGMAPGMGGAAPAAPAAALPPGQILDPLEASRANPFAPRSTIAAVGAAAAAMVRPHYGPDWSQLPIAERVAFVRPEIPAAPTPPLPSLQTTAEGQLRVTSVLWDASGQAIAAYEDPEGERGELRPGDRVPGTGMTVREITRTGVVLENARTGESQELELRPRVESTQREQPSRRQPRPGTTRGRTAPGGGNFPAAPPAR
ncbi:MAG: hypothetical protein GX100_04480 [candidate division WS1 bacterium]|nr:hypothetical protein [candidate division WS1 bacterium]